MAKAAQKKPEDKKTRTAGTVRASKTYVDFAALLKKTGHNGRAYQKETFMSTGLTLVDAITGQGLLGGRFAMIHGDEMTYKSSFSYHCGGIAQQLGGAVWVDDPEDKWDWDVAVINGLDPASPNFYYTQSKNAEEYLSLLQNWIDNSREATTPQYHAYDSLGVIATTDQQTSEKDHPMSVAKRLASWISTSNLKHITNLPVYITWLNQQRDGIDFHSYGPPKPKLPGGRATKHKVSLRLRMNSMALGQTDKDKDTASPIGKLVKFTGEKIPGMPDQRWCIVPYFFHFGFDDALSCLNYLIGMKHIRKGTEEGIKQKYGINGTFMHKGEWREKFYNDPGVAREIRSITRKLYIADNSYKGGEADACGDEE